MIIMFVGKHSCRFDVRLRSTKERARPSQCRVKSFVRIESKAKDGLLDSYLTELLLGRWDGCWLYSA